MPSYLVAGASITLDVLSQADVDAAVTAVLAETGSLDVLIFNAGAASAHGTSVVDLNTVAPHRVIRAFLPLIRKGQAKKIIAIGSAGGTFEVAQRLVRADFPVGPYGVSKAGMHFLMALHGAELASEGIAVASIYPGMVDTNGAQRLLERMGDSARAVIEQMGVKILSTKESAAGLVRVINGLTLQQSGLLLDIDGAIMPF